MEKMRGCFICGRPSTEKFCVLHRWTRNKCRPHVCGICDKAFKQASQLSCHREIHNNKKPQVSIHCEHSYSLTPTVQKPYLCDICGQNFSWRKTLVKHQAKIHSHTTVTICKPSTDHVFDTKTTHLADKKLCETCGKVFAQKNDLARHLKHSHGNDRPFLCGICGKTFAQNFDLVRHKRTHTKEKPFDCSICEHSFSRKHHLEDHLRTHTKVKPYLCEGCGKSFSHKNSVVNHGKKCTHTTEATEIVEFLSQKRHIGALSSKPDEEPHNSQTTCSDTGNNMIPAIESSISDTWDQASYWNNQVNQQTTDITETPSLCDIVDEAFRQSNDILSELSYHKTTEGKQFPCEYCNKTFAKTFDLTRHKRIHTNDKPFICVICGKRFTQKHHLHEHQVTHTKEKLFICNKCHQAFAHRGQLLRHQKNSKCTQTAGQTAQNQEATDKYYDPDMCGEDYEQECHISDHQITHTTDNQILNAWNEASYWSACSSTINHPNETTQTPEQASMCDISNKTVTDSKGLTPNKRTYTDRKHYACDFCIKVFVRKCDFTRHRRIHTKEKPFLCDTCDKRFTQKRHLVEHLRTHTKEQPFVCDSCSQAFSHKKSLLKHQKRRTCTHTKLTIQSYVCDVCDKTFTQRCRLSRHKRSHTKPYTCDLCDRRFSQKHSIVEHKRCHSREKQFLCERCGQAFLYRSNFSYHLKKNACPQSTLTTQNRKLVLNESTCTKKEVLQM